MKYDKKTGAARIVKHKWEKVPLPKTPAAGLLSSQTSGLLLKEEGT